MAGYGAKTPGWVVFAKPNFYWLKIKIKAIIFLSYLIDKPIKPDKPDKLIDKKIKLIDKALS